MSQARPTAEVFELHDTITSWDHDYYHPIAEWYYDRAVETMLRLMGAKPGDLVLDGGCGPGVHSVRAARYGCRVHAIDISEAMLGEARRRVERAGFGERVKFQQQDLTNLTLPDGAFQYVFSWGVIIHIREVEKALDHLARVVTPGGKLALYVTNRTAWDHWLESMLRFLIRKPLAGLERLPLGDGVWYDMHGEKLWVWRIDAKAVTRYMEGRGFRRTHRVIGEFTEIQRRTKGWVRRILLRLNNLAYRLKLPARAAVTQLLVFEKSN